MENLLEVRGLCKNYKTFSLQNISFSLPGGSIMGIVGENGAGKTTTLQLILNEIRRDGGIVKIFGKDNIRDEIPIKREIGVVADECRFHSVFNAVDIGKILMHVFPTWDGSLFQKYLRDFSIPEKKTIKEYSRGMKMKLSIAAALSHHPRLLILDEATSGLDPVIRSDILDLLLDFIQDENHGVLFSSHITSDLERIADYVTFLHQGKIIFSQSKDDLLESFGILKCGTSRFSELDKSKLIRYRRGMTECEALVKDKDAARRKYPDLVIDSATLDDIMVLYAKGEQP